MDSVRTTGGLKTLRSLVEALSDFGKRPAVLESARDQAVRSAVEEQGKKLPSYQRISDYVLSHQALPRTQLGKIQRHKLLELYEQLQKGTQKRGQENAGEMIPAEMNPEDQALLATPAAQQVWDWLAGRYPDCRLTPDTSLPLDLGIDSLE